MSTIITKDTLEADYKKNMVAIAKSNLDLKINGLNTAAVPFTVMKKNVQLMEFSDASW